MLSLDELYKARFVLSKILRRTELVRARQMNNDSEIYFKPENLQITGSFKIRGAYYKISQLTPEEKKRGVVACSAGTTTRTNGNIRLWLVVYVVPCRF